MHAIWVTSRRTWKLLCSLKAVKSLKCGEINHTTRALQKGQARREAQGRGSAFCVKECLTNPVTFHDGVMATVDKRRATDIIYIDFCRAFIWFPTTSLPLNLRYIGLMDGVIDR